jgi:tRNA(His) 5'-end guanylyltransferase
MPVNDDLGKRMKENYEGVSKTRLIKRMPVAIRLDGKAFHTFTRDFKKPFDRILMASMQDTMKYLCENIQGCVIGYTQSDEITLILKDYTKLETSAWFDYEVQKICSISASMATMAFNKAFGNRVAQEILDYKASLVPQSVEIQKEMQKYHDTLRAASYKGAMFDARCFNIPKEEVANLIYWRQLDAVRNSIQMVGQANFSHKELQEKSCNMIQEMLFQEKGINWNNYPTDCKRGSCCVKNYYQTDGETLVYEGKFGEWVIDYDIPTFKGEFRYYIEKFLKADDEKTNTEIKMGII